MDDRMARCPNTDYDIDSLFRMQVKMGVGWVWGALCRFCTVTTQTTMSQAGESEQIWVTTSYHETVFKTKLLQKHNVSKSEYSLPHKRMISLQNVYLGKNR